MAEAKGNDTILILEDNPDDVLLLQRALQKNNIKMPLQILSDGEEGIAYLKGEDKYADRLTFPFPRVIILDLKMPRKGGLEVLDFLSNHPDLRVIPTIVLTT